MKKIHLFTLLFLSFLLNNAEAGSADSDQQSMQADASSSSSTTEDPTELPSDEWDYSAN